MKLQRERFSQIFSKTKRRTASVLEHFRERSGDARRDLRQATAQYDVKTTADEAAMVKGRQ